VPLEQLGQRSRLAGFRAADQIIDVFTRDAHRIRPLSAIIITANRSAVFTEKMRVRAEHHREGGKGLQEGTDRLACDGVPELEKPRPGHVR
jgi:hypothetical protein